MLSRQILYYPPSRPPVGFQAGAGHPRGGRGLWAHLGTEVVLLKLATLAQVPAAHSVVQAPSPQPGPII